MTIRLLSLLFLSSCARTPELITNQAETAPMEDPLKVNITTLENGLTVYLSENHEEPRIAARVVVRAGGAQDDPQATGMAHYLEHMLANKGTKRLGTVDFLAEKPLLDEIRTSYDELFKTADTAKREELYKKIDELGQAANQYTIANELKQTFGLLGGRGFNAFTSRDQTAYVIDIPSNNLEPWSILEGDRFANAVFRSFQTEVETVYEEKNRAMDSADRQIYDAVSAALFEGHPYGRSVLGSIEHLKNPSISRMEEFFKKWYVPNNMAVVLAGDFDSETALALITREFSNLKPGELPEDGPSGPEPLTAPLTLQIQHNADEQVRLAWQTVGSGHPDEAALVLADMLLDNSASGILDRNLNNPQKVRSSGSSASVMRFAGYQQVWGRPRAEQSLGEVQALLIEQVESVKNGQFTDEELDAIRLNFRVRETGALESNAARVGLMMKSFVNEEEWSYTRGLLKRYDAVTREDIQRVARQYFGENKVILTLVSGEPEIPKIEAPTLGERPLNTQAHSALFTKVTEMETPELGVQSLIEGQDYLVKETVSGLLYTVENPYSDLSAVQLWFETGKRRDPLLCVGTNLWKRSGVGEMDQNAWEAWLYQRSISLGVSCGEESISITLSGPAAQLAEAIPMVEQRLAEPNLDEAVGKAYLEDYLARRQDNKITAKLHQSVLRKFGLYGEDSPYLKAASDEEILGTTFDEYLGKVKALNSYKRTMLYVGPLSLEEVEEELIDPSRSYEEFESFPVNKYVSSEGSRILFLDFDSVQAKITVYGPDVVLNHEDSAQYALYGELMGGSAGLVFQEIREARSLAYSASGGYSTGSEVGDQNLLWGVVACQADKTVVATGLLVDMLHNLPDEASRWERIQPSAIQRQISSRIRFRSIPGAVESWRRRGLDEDPRAGLAKSIGEKTYEDLKIFASRFRELPFTILVVGNSKNIDLESLESIAPVTEVQLEDLMAY